MCSKTVESPKFASYFDIDWSADPLQRSRILLPVLGDSYGKVARKPGACPPLRRPGLFRPVLRHAVPHRPETYRQILGACLEEMEESGAPVKSIRTTLHALCELSGELAARAQAPLGQRAFSQFPVSKLEK